MSEGMRVRIGGYYHNGRYVGSRYWTLRWGNPGPHDDGDADDGRRELRIRPNLSPRVELETILHELLHASVWELSENFVLRLGRALTHTLWCAGYRRSDLDSEMQGRLRYVYQSRHFRELRETIRTSLTKAAWDVLCDSWITKASRDIAYILWRLGYRLKE